MKDDKSINSIISIYGNLKEQEAILKSKINECKESIATYMHNHNLDSLVIEDILTSKLWSCAYQTRETSSTNYQLLMEIIGKDRYHEVVTNKISTNLVIREKKQTIQKSELTTTSPDSRRGTPTPPVGIIV